MVGPLGHALASHAISTSSEKRWLISSLTSKFRARAGFINRFSRTNFAQSRSQLFELLSLCFPWVKMEEKAASVRWRYLSDSVLLCEFNLVSVYLHSSSQLHRISGWWRKQANLNGYFNSIFMKECSYFTERIKMGEIWLLQLYCNPSSCI